MNMNITCGETGRLGQCRLHLCQEGRGGRRGSQLEALLQCHCGGQAGRLANQNVELDYNEAGWRPT